jgi:Ca2+-binding EF-hand superfamily protein
MIFAPVLMLPAQETMATGPSARAAKRADELLKRFDRNGDGKLDDDERAEAKELMLSEQVERQMAQVRAVPGGLEAFRAQALQMFDRNRDGRLDEDERNAAQAFAARRKEAEIEGESLNRHFDQNADGKIDASEANAMQRYLAALRELGSTQMRAELLRRFDHDSDGKLSEGELGQVEKFLRPRIESSTPQLRRWDSDHDGKLNDTEWDVARAAITRWLNAAGPDALEFEPFSATPRQVALEGERLKAVAAEVARRRALREANPTSPPK